MYRFRVPPTRGLNETALEVFLGDDFDSILTSVDRPPEGSVAPKACDLLPAKEGSAGTIHL